MNDAAEIRAARVRLHESSVRITMLGGQAPVQGEGFIGSDQRWYFRSRGEKWNFEVYATGRPFSLSHVEFDYEEAYGEWPEAGFISELQALQFIEKAVEAYHEWLAGMDLR